MNTIITEANHESFGLSDYNQFLFFCLNQGMNPSLQESYSSYENLHRSLLNGTTLLFMKEASGLVVGLLEYNYGDDNTESTYGKLNLLAIDVSNQGGGLASSLNNRYEKNIKKKGVLSSLAEVNINSPMKIIADKWGYNQIPGLKKGDQIIMKKTF